LAVADFAAAAFGGLFCDNGAGDEVVGRKRFFFEKKKQKTFIYWGICRWRCLGPKERKFFASFFQKRSAFFFLTFVDAGIRRHDGAARFGDSASLGEALLRVAEVP
jgi:hypothetical protein